MNTFSELVLRLNQVSENVPPNPRSRDGGSSANAPVTPDQQLSFDLAKLLKLRRSAQCYRGACPRPACDGRNWFTLSLRAWPDGGLHAHCRRCGQATSVPIGIDKPIEY